MTPNERKEVELALEAAVKADALSEPRFMLEAWQRLSAYVEQHERAQRQLRLEALWTLVEKTEEIGQNAKERGNQDAAVAYFFAARALEGVLRESGYEPKDENKP